MSHGNIADRHDYVLSAEYFRYKPETFDTLELAVAACCYTRALLSPVLKMSKTAHDCACSIRHISRDEYTALLADFFLNIFLSSHTS